MPFRQLKSFFKILIGVQYKILIFHSCTECSSPPQRLRSSRWSASRRDGAAPLFHEIKALARRDPAVRDLPPRMTMVFVPARILSSSFSPRYRNKPDVPFSPFFSPAQRGQTVHSDCAPAGSFCISNRQSRLPDFSRDFPWRNHEYRYCIQIVRISPFSRSSFLPECGDTLRLLPCTSSRHLLSAISETGHWKKSPSQFFG